MLISGLLLLLLSPNVLPRQTNMNPVGSDKSGSSGNRWSLETSLTFPMVRIYMLKLFYAHSDIIEKHKLAPGKQKNYYDLMEAQKQHYLNQYGHVEEARQVVESEMELEMSLYQKYKDYYSYVFYVMQKA